MLSSLYSATGLPLPHFVSLLCHTCRSDANLLESLRSGTAGLETLLPLFAPVLPAELFVFSMAAGTGCFPFGQNLSATGPTLTLCCDGAGCWSCGHLYPVPPAAPASELASPAVGPTIIAPTAADMPHGAATECPPLHDDLSFGQGLPVSTCWAACWDASPPSGVANCFFDVLGLHRREVVAAAVAAADALPPSSSVLGFKSRLLQLLDSTVYVRALDVQILLLLVPDGTAPLVTRWRAHSFQMR